MKSLVNIIETEDSRDFVGVKIENNIINIYVPFAFRYDTNNISKSKDDIILLLKSLELAKTYNLEQAFVSKTINQGLNWSLDSYIWIINDFVENGLYYEQQKKYSINEAGKINWKKTMEKPPMYFTNNLIYTDLVSTTKHNNFGEITEIYKYCLKLALDRIGWLYDYKINLKIDTFKTKNEMTYILKKEINITFEDKKRIMLNHLLKIIQSIKGDSSQNLNFHTYGITHYYYVFERLIDIYFGNISINDKHRYNPNSHWELISKEKKYNNPLLVDTIHEKFINNQLYTYIIDSKFYSFGTNKNPYNLPGSQDIQKQITYGDFVINNVHKHKNVKVRNIFFLPFNKKHYSDDDKNLKLFGHATADWVDNKKEHHLILGFLIDFNFLLKNYKLNAENNFDDVINQTENYLLSLSMSE